MRVSASVCAHKLYTLAPFHWDTRIFALSDVIELWLVRYRRDTQQLAGELNDTAIIEIKR